MVVKSWTMLMVNLDPFFIETIHQHPLPPKPRWTLQLYQNLGPRQQSCLVKALPPGDHQRRPAETQCRIHNPTAYISASEDSYYESPESNQMRERARISAKDQISSNTMTSLLRVWTYPWNEVIICQCRGHRGNPFLSNQPHPYHPHLTLTLCNEVQHGLCVLKQLEWKWSTCRSNKGSAKTLLWMFWKIPLPQETTLIFTWWSMKFPNVEPTRLRQRFTTYRSASSTCPQECLVSFHNLPFLGEPVQKYMTIALHMKGPKCERCLKSRDLGCSFPNSVRQKDRPEAH